MNTCARCGQGLGIGRFCLNCGHPIGEPVPEDARPTSPLPPERAAAPDPAAPRTPRQVSDDDPDSLFGGRRPWWLIMVAVALAVVVTLMVLIATEVGGG